MGVSTTINRVAYNGDGTTTAFSFPYYFFQASDFIVYIYNTTTAVSSKLVLGTDYTVTGTPNLQMIYPNGGGISLLVSVTLPFGTIPTGSQIQIIRDPIRTQNFSLIQNGVINALSVSQEFDYLTLLIQRLEDRVTRAVRLPDSVPVTFSGLLPNGVAITPNALIAINSTGTGIAFGPPTTSLPVGGSSLLGLPTDGAYGTHLPGDPSTAGPITGINQGITVNDAFDDVENTFQKLAPAPPINLSAEVMTIAGSYNSLRSVTGVAVPITTNSASPAVLAATPFSSGSSGVLSTTMDGTAEGSITVAAGVTATNLWLQITSNADPYVGQFGKAGFYYALLAQINAVSLAVGAHIAVMIHSVTGSSTLNFDVDDSTTPSIGTTSAVGSGTAGYVSGVPALLTGGVVTPTFTVSNAIKSHYNAVRIAAASLFGVTVNSPLPGTPPANGAAFVAAPAITVVAGQYSETPTLALNGYAANGTLGTTNITPSIRVDSLSNESARCLSGSGQFPSGGYGGAWVAATSLASNVELQMLGGSYQYPPAVSYTGNLPTAGPNYSSLSPDSYANMRWVTFNYTTLSNASNVTITLQGEQNFGSTTLISGFVMYVFVVGSGMGWLDANAAYPGTGTPFNNGDPALDIANSSVTVRKVTFGAATRTGACYVRIGIPSGSTKKFTGII